MGEGMQKGPRQCNCRRPDPFLATRSEGCVSALQRFRGRRMAPNGAKICIARGSGISPRRIRQPLRPCMPATPNALFATLDDLGIAHATVTHPPLFTVEESRAL